MRAKLALLATALTAAAGAAHPQTAETRATSAVRYQRVSQVVGTTVTVGSQDIGKVTEVVLNDAGCVEYVVVKSADGFVAIPWGVTRVDYDRRVVTVTNAQVTPDRLREVVFTESQWPNFADQQWSQRTRTVWGTVPGRVNTGVNAPDRRDQQNQTRPDDRRPMPPDRPRDQQPDQRRDQNDRDRDRRDEQPGTRPGTTPPTPPANPDRR